MINKEIQYALADIMAIRDKMLTQKETLPILSHEKAGTMIAIGALSEIIKDTEKVLCELHPDYPDIEHWTDKPKTYRRIIRIPANGLREDNRVLVWSKNLEHAVYHIDDVIHPEADCIWFQIKKMDSPSTWADYIVKYRRDSPQISGYPYGTWGTVEGCWGTIDFRYNNPFGIEPVFEKRKDVDYEEILETPNGFRCEDPFVLVFSKDREQGTFHIWDYVHPEAVEIWYQVLFVNEWKDGIFKYRKDESGEWKCFEQCIGRILFDYHSPSDIESVFEKKTFDDDYIPDSLRDEINKEKK